MKMSQKGSNMAKTNVNKWTAEQFVTAYIEAFKANKSIQDLTEELGYRKPSDLRKRKQHYQKRGVNLPELRDDVSVFVRPLDVKALNELMKDLL